MIRNNNNKIHREMKMKRKIRCKEKVHLCRWMEIVIIWHLLVVNRKYFILLKWLLFKKAREKMNFWTFLMLECIIREVLGRHNIMLLMLLIVILQLIVRMFHFQKRKKFAKLLILVHSKCLVLGPMNMFLVLKKLAERSKS